MNVTGFLIAFTRFYWVSNKFDQFSWVVLGCCTGLLYWVVVLGCWYKVLQGYSGLNWFLNDEGNGKFNLMLLCWGENHSSAVHDHSDSHGVTKMLDGELREGCLAQQGHEVCQLEETGSSVWHENQVGFINDSMSLHPHGWATATCWTETPPRKGSWLKSPSALRL